MHFYAFFISWGSPGYYSTQTNPTAVFRCNSALVCPGGTPGSCGGGLVDTPCSQCREGETWTGSLCEQCGAWRRVLWVVMLLCIFAFLTLAYYLTTSKAGFKETDANACSNNTRVHNGLASDFGGSMCGTNLGRSQPKPPCSLRPLRPLACW